MATDQRERIRQAVAKRGFPITIFSLFFVGVVDLVRAWQKHDAREAIAVAIIFFIIAPLFAWLWHKTIGPEIDD